jgi:arylsulfatase A-like enzyme
LFAVAGRTAEERYEIAIRYLDLQIDALLRELERRGLLKNTLVVLVSDHGEQFGTHGLGDHGNSLYAPSLHVPLVLMLPDRVPGGRRIEAAVSLQNLPATVLDVVGIENEGRIPGTSWSRLWVPSNGQGEPDPLIFSSLEPKRRTPPNHRNALGELRSLIEGSYHYINNGDGSEEFYAFPADSEERTNLIAGAEGREPLERMRASLRRIDSLHPRRAVAR